jgi:hypothetical protein
MDLILGRHFPIGEIDHFSLPEKTGRHQYPAGNDPKNKQPE